MFFNCTNFNQDLKMGSKLNKGETMYAMFDDCTKFNGNLSDGIFQKLQIGLYVL